MSTWNGTLAPGTVPDPSACTDSTCPARSLALALARDAFAGRPTGMLVALRYNDGAPDELNDVELYVYGPDGKLAATSDALDNIKFGTGQAAWVQDPVNGSYRVEVVPKLLGEGVPYTVDVRFERGYTVKQTRESAGSPAGGTVAQSLVFLGRRPRRPRVLLPDMVPGKPTDFHIETTVAAQFYLAEDHGLRHQPSCYPQEMAPLDADNPTAPRSTPLKCLRWDQSLVNRGPGYFEVHAYLSDQGQGSSSKAYQILFRTDGKQVAHELGHAEFSPAHGHVHFFGLDDTALYTIGPNGQPDVKVAAMTDKGRCATDTDPVSFGRYGMTPLHYLVPSTCDGFDNSDRNDPVHPGDQYFRSGIAPGWADTYPWYIPDQYIDITNVPDGRYLLVDRLNVNGALRETTRSNDSSEACVDIQATTVTTCG